jgi:hypothetical protein
MSYCCHATHNISFYVQKLRNYIDLPDDLPDNSLYMLSVESTQDYVAPPHNSSSAARASSTSMAPARRLLLPPRQGLVLLEVGDVHPGGS